MRINRYRKYLVTSLVYKKTSPSPLGLTEIFLKRFCIIALDFNLKMKEVNLQKK